jgi:magnesium chelatase family protein
MALTQLTTRAQLGIDAPEVRVEVHISNGLPNFTVVGLPETAVREARDRVRSAILNSGFEFPVRRITVNLAPADLRKEGGRYDLPIALGRLAASEQIQVSSLERVDWFVCPWPSPWRSRPRTAGILISPKFAASSRLVAHSKLPPPVAITC